MIDQLDDDLRGLMARLDEMTPMPPAFEDLARVAGRRRADRRDHRALVAVGAIAIIALAVGGLALLRVTREGGAPASSTPPPTTPSTTTTPTALELDDLQAVLPPIALPDAPGGDVLGVSAGAHTATLVVGPDDRVAPRFAFCILEFDASGNGHTCASAPVQTGLFTAPGLTEGARKSLVALTANTVAVTGDGCDAVTSSSAGLALTICTLAAEQDHARLTFALSTGETYELSWVAPDRGSDAARSPEDVAGTWIYVAKQQLDGTSLPLANPLPTYSFALDGTVTGFDGCGAVAATWTIEDETIVAVPESVAGTCTVTSGELVGAIAPGPARVSPVLPDGLAMIRDSPDQETAVQLEDLERPADISGTEWLLPVDGEDLTVRFEPDGTLRILVGERPCDDGQYTYTDGSLGVFRRADKPACAAPFLDHLGLAVALYSDGYASDTLLLAGSAGSLRLFPSGGSSVEATTSTLAGD